MEKTLYATRVLESSDDYCALITEGCKVLRTYQPLPAGMTGYDAESALDDMLTALRAREAGPLAAEAPASIGMELKAVLESVATGLKGGTVPAVKFGCGFQRGPEGYEIARAPVVQAQLPEVYAGGGCKEIGTVKGW